MNKINCMLFLSQEILEVQEKYQIIGLSKDIFVNLRRN